jgi:hypothetical protein
VNASKGLSAVHLSRDLDAQYNTAFLLMHKLREALAHETAEARLAGVVEIDAPILVVMSAPPTPGRIVSIAGF